MDNKYIIREIKENKDLICYIFTDRITYEIYKIEIIDETKNIIMFSPIGDYLNKIDNTKINQNVVILLSSITGYASFKDEQSKKEYYKLLRKS